MSELHHQVQRIKAGRKEARTNLLWLCNHVLGFKDINKKIHGDILDALQHFEGGTDVWTPQGWNYTPACPIHDLTGNRKSLILVSRDFMKTSICSVAHTIQWILAYPDVRILLCTATAMLSTSILGQVKEHFTSNPVLRDLFPEYCPPVKKSGKVDDFGNQEQFTSPARRSKVIKEATVRIATVETKISGYHVDVAKCDDIVDRENSRTSAGLELVKGFYSFLDPIVDHYQSDKIKPEVFEKYGNHGWNDVIGTRYDFSDLYGSILDADTLRVSQGFPRSYNTVVRSALAQGQSAYDKDALAAWPERMPLTELQKKESTDLEMTCSQYYMNPIPASSGLVDSDKQILFIPRKAINDLLPRLRLHVTIDLHGMEPDAKGKDNDYTAMVLAGFGRDGRPYIVDIFHGRPDPFEVIENIFAWYRRYPRIVEFKVQKDHFARVLAPFFHRECARRNTYPILTQVPISNQISKKQKIKGLQPWFRNGDIRFAEDLMCRNALINEIMRFPRYAHDDLLDALSDQLTNRDGERETDVLPQAKAEATIANPAFRGFNPISGAPEFDDLVGEVAGQHDLMTGF